MKGHCFKSLHFRGKAANNSCLLQNVKNSACTPGETPVYLNVYDMTSANRCVYWAGLGIFHSGIEVHGTEYSFGDHDDPTSGIFEVEPRTFPGLKFRKSICIGTTSLDPIQMRVYMKFQADYYRGDSYHWIVKNCNHFCEDVCKRLTGKCIPKWINRLARIGS